VPTSLDFRLIYRFCMRATRREGGFFIWFDGLMVDWFVGELANQPTSQLSNKHPSKGDLSHENCQ
jgi:hypothetical protein